MRWFEIGERDGSRKGGVEADEKLVGLVPGGCVVMYLPTDTHMHAHATRHMTVSQVLTPNIL